MVSTSEDSKDPSGTSRLSNKANDFKIDLAQDTTSDDLVKIKKDQYEVSWNIENAKKSTAQIIKDPVDKLQTTLSDEAKKKIVKNLNFEVTYPDIFQDVDLNYSINSNHLKENIILKQATDVNTFTLDLATKNVLPQLMKDNSVVFYEVNKNDPWAWASLGADVVGAVLPGVTGGRLAVKGLENLVDACFTEDTKIQTKDGHILIKDIKVGDKVYSENPETGEKGLKKVKNVYIHETDTLIHVMIGDAEIKTTPTHPFWVVGKGWVEAGKLNIGERLLLSSGETSQIDAISNEQLNKPIKVYNFEVEDWHTYFVSDEKVLVHNSCSVLLNYITYCHRNIPIISKMLVWI